jgi:hypothetical protein
VIPLLVVLAAAPLDTPPLAAERRGKAFWTTLAAECAVPPGETAAGLVNEVVALTASPDSEWRDAVGYDVFASCVYSKKRLEPGERRGLVTLLSQNLRRGIGETGNDGVLQRSFSALDLSVLAALELQDPALDAAGYARLLDDGLAYLKDERDLRGLEPRVGWIHATAHTADLLKFLARDARFKPEDQARLFDAAWSKMTALGTPVFTHAEDERLAAALVSWCGAPTSIPRASTRGSTASSRSRNRSGRNRRRTARRSTPRRTRATCCAASTRSYRCRSPPPRAARPRRARKRSPRSRRSAADAVSRAPGYLLRLTSTSESKPSSFFPYVPDV